MGEKLLFEEFRDASLIRALASKIEQEASMLKEPLPIMEVCGGHTHTIMRYGLNQLLPSNVYFVHGPGCPVCIMPKERIDAAIALCRLSNVILVTLGDMIRVPGSKKNLATARQEGADVRTVYSPLDIIEIAKQNPQKTVVYFAIGFETTTPMSAALLARVEREGTTNLLFHINHVTVPQPMAVICDDAESKVAAFLAPAHVSVITGSKIYEPIAQKYSLPIVVGGFEPLDVMSSILSLVQLKNSGKNEVHTQYSRSVTKEGNVAAQQVMQRYFEVANSFRWRGIGDIEKSSLKLKKEYEKYDAEKVFAQHLPTDRLDDHKLCICGDILKGKAKPFECKVFGTACTPQNPLGSCMVSSEGACAAYYKYGKRP